MPAHLSRARALGLIVLIWAGIYLPALGTLEIKGEEGRRILPGITMLETGNWIVPAVGGVDYFSKPPLINWAIAGAVHVSGRQDEWAARTPSVLCVLALGLGTVWLLADWLGTGGALLAAIFMLTGIGLMEKGRLAEIESMYICLYGLALVSWLSLWRRGRWLAWIVPWFFLGLGLLTKGPLHVVYFYAVVVGILVAARRTRELWNWPHLAGVVLMLGIFAAWAVPYVHLTAAERVGNAWTRQMANRLEVDDAFRPGMWALNIPRGLVNLTPWVVLLPLLWRGRSRLADVPAEAGAAADLAILRGGRWAVAACFLVVGLAPGGLPRYTLPLLVPVGVLLALVCTREEIGGPLPAWFARAWQRTLAVWLALAAFGAALTALYGPLDYVRTLAGVALLIPLWWLTRRLREMHLAHSGVIPGLALVSAGLMAVLTLEYALAAVPRLLAKERLRPLADHLNEIVADAPPVYAYQPGFLPLLYYSRPNARYTQRIADLPPAAHYLLVSAKDAPAVEKQLAARGIAPQRVLKMDRLTRGTWYALRLERPSEKN